MRRLRHQPEQRFSGHPSEIVQLGRIPSRAAPDPSRSEGVGAPDPESGHSHTSTEGGIAPMAVVSAPCSDSRMRTRNPGAWPPGMGAIHPKGLWGGMRRNRTFGSRPSLADCGQSAAGPVKFRNRHSNGILQARPFVRGLVLLCRQPVLGPGFPANHARRNFLASHIPPSAPSTNLAARNSAISGSKWAAYCRHLPNPRAFTGWRTCMRLTVRTVR
jgi:hypothetical protein